MYWIWTLIVGAIIGIIAGAITSKGKSMGWISNIIAGLIGFGRRPGAVRLMGTTAGGNGTDSFDYRSCHRRRSRVLLRQQVK